MYELKAKFAFETSCKLGKLGRWLVGYRPMHLALRLNPLCKAGVTSSGDCEAVLTLLTSMTMNGFEPCEKGVFSEFLRNLRCDTHLKSELCQA